MPCNNHTSSIPHTSIAVNLAPSHSFSKYTCNTNSPCITVTENIYIYLTPHQHFLTVILVPIKDFFYILDPTPRPTCPVSHTLYNRTSWTTQHALSSDYLPIITTINIRHDYRLQQNRQTFTNYKKADWTQFTEDTESAFAQTTIHTANRIYTNIILMVDQHNISKGKMHSNCRLLPDHISIHNHPKKQHKESKHLWSSSQTLK